MSASVPRFRILLSHDTIQRRIRELALAIESELPVPEILLVVVIEGARTFASHLRRHLAGSPSMQEIRASSYDSGTSSNRPIRISGLPEVAVADRMLLLVEDIIDTGRTIAALRSHYLARGARQCWVASLLSKPARREVEAPIDFLGFEIPDEFVIGFGMDVGGRYRDVADVVVYDPEIELRAAAPDSCSDAEFGQQGR